MMVSLSTKISELACFFGASETKKDQMEVSCAAASKDGALFATGVNKTLKVYIIATYYCVLLVVHCCLLFVVRYTTSKIHWHVVHPSLTHRLYTVAQMEE